MRTDGVHCREFAGTGPVNLMVVVTVTGAAFASPWTNEYAALSPTPTIGTKWATVCFVCMYICKYIYLNVCMYVCIYVNISILMYVCMFIKLHITAQSGPVIYSFYATGCNPPGGYLS